MAAASKNYRFLSGSDRDAPIGSDSVFELDEAEVWSEERSASPPECRMAMPSARASRKQSSDRDVRAAPASLPVSVPDWSKILKEEYKENRRRECEEEEFDESYGDDRVPPHEFLARQLARTRIASFSVHEGVGRTLKGRDLSKVRNAIWEKTGFQD